MRAMERSIRLADLPEPVTNLSGWLTTVPMPEPRRREDEEDEG